jgi:hypothetical protein
MIRAESRPEAVVAVVSDWDADIGAGGDGANNGNVQWVGGSFYGVEHGNEGKA